MNKKNKWTQEIKHMVNFLFWTDLKVWCLSLHFRNTCLFFWGIWSVFSDGILLLLLICRLLESVCSERLTLASSLPDARQSRKKKKNHICVHWWKLRKVYLSLGSTSVGMINGQSQPALGKMIPGQSCILLCVLLTPVHLTN